MGTFDGAATAFAQTRSMGEDLLDGDVRRAARGRLQGGKLGNELFDWIAYLQLPLMLQHEGGNRREGFGHGVNPEKTVEFHGLFLRNIGQADGIYREQLVLRSDHRDRSGNILCVNKLFDGRANG